MRVQKTLSSHVLLSSFLLRSNRTTLQAQVYRVFNHADWPITRRHSHWLCSNFLSITRWLQAVLLSDFNYKLVAILRSAVTCKQACSKLYAKLLFLIILACSKQLAHKSDLKKIVHLWVYTPLAKLLARQARPGTTQDGSGNKAENYSSISTTNQRQLRQKMYE